MDEVKTNILDLLRKEGPQPVYKIAKALGLSYGAAQWHIFYLERQGLVKTYKVGNRRYAAINPAADALSIIKVEDVLEDVALTLMAYGIKPNMTVAEAVERLERVAPHLAELVKMMAEERYKERERRGANV